MISDLICTLLVLCFSEMFLYDYYISVYICGIRLCSELFRYITNVLHTVLESHATSCFQSISLLEPEDTLKKKKKMNSSGFLANNRG